MKSLEYEAYEVGRYLEIESGQDRVSSRAALFRSDDFDELPRI